jgi:uncharacterized OB-fold protein
MVMHRGGGSEERSDVRDWDLTVDYEPESADQEEEDDDEPNYVIGDIRVDANRAWADYQETLPEEVARKKAVRLAYQKKQEEEERLRKVATLKTMLAELGEKV